MAARSRALAGAMLSAILFAEAAGASAQAASSVSRAAPGAFTVIAANTSTGRSTARIGFTTPTVLAAVPPLKRILVPEPTRRRPVPRPAPRSIRPVISKDVRAAHGVSVNGPVMPRTSEINLGVSQARVRAARGISQMHPTAPTVVAPVKGTDVERSRGVAPAGRPLASPKPNAPIPSSGPRNALSLNGASGTGVNAWWRYAEEKAPGLGDVKINVGTGNMVFNATDMSVPHKGLPLAYTRTFNSQSAHDVNGSDGSPPSLYGNGWTSSFDAHVSGNDATGPLTVWDIDGARYDYTLSGDGVTWLSSTAGQHATLYVGGCGVAWSKPDGTIYVFYRLNFAACGLSQTTYGGYAGRTYEILGRNENTHLLFGYAWDGGNFGPTGRISAISVTTESGLQASLLLADVYGHRLVTSLTRPDGTTISYSYDGWGNVGAANHPANNANGIGPTEWYGYVQSNGFNVMDWAASPRWARSCNIDDCSSDGGYLKFSYQLGSSTGTTNLSQIDHFYVVNPKIADGVSTGPMQPGVPIWDIDYLVEYFTIGTSTPTLRDSDGHMTNWIVDGAGRPTQSQNCTASVNQGQQCNAWLVTGYAWDANNNLTSTIEPRGYATGVNPQTYETDYAFDANGNMIAAASPQTVTSDGTFRPTRLYDYDPFNNLLAYCNESETHQAHADWAGAPTPSDSLCTTAAGNGTPYARLTYSYPAIEPYGELTSVVTPQGYTRRLTYAASQQAGVDYGLPTSVTGDVIGQFTSSITPSQSFWYDANGYVRCLSRGQGTWVASYDALGRATSIADPDDSSANSSSLCGKSSGQAGWNTQTTYTRFPDGSLQTSQTPSERTVGVSTAYTYDTDGDLLTQTLHHGCVPNQSCVAGMTQSWYDATDRVIETKYPIDPNSAGDFPWIMRYLYDLSEGAGSTTLSGNHVMASGNLFEVQKSTPTGWTDQAFAAYDTVDRITDLYQYAPCPSGSTAGAVYCTSSPYSTTYNWDANPQSLGLLASTRDGLGEIATYAYDTLGNTTAIQYSGDGGATPAVQYAYDASSRVATATAAGVGTQMYSYTPDGLIRTIQEPALLASGIRTYSYNGDSSLAQVDIADPLLNQTQMFRYAYRTDGLLASEKFGLGGATMTFAYTDAGRGSSLTDVSTPPSRTEQYGSNGLVTSYTIPAGTYSNVTYDAEANVTGYQAYGGETVANTYNDRGEVVAQSFNPNPATRGFTAWPSFQYQSVQGVIVQSSSEQWDGRTGAIVELGVPFIYDAVGRLSQFSSGIYGKYFFYDAENRLTAGSTNQVIAQGNCGSARTIQGVRAGGNGGYMYGPDGQIVQSINVGTDGGRTAVHWHWNQGNLLYTDSNNAAGFINADGEGILSPSGGSPGLTVYDRELNGLVTSRHNLTGHAAWTAPNPFLQKCVEQNPPPASSGYTDPTIAITPAPPDQYDDGNSTISPSGKRSWVAGGIGNTTPSGSVSLLAYAGHSPIAMDIVGQNCAYGTDPNTLQCYPFPQIGHVDSGSYPCPGCAQGGPTNLTPRIFGGPRTPPPPRKPPPPKTPLLCNVAPGMWGLFLSAGGSDQSPEWGGGYTGPGSMTSLQLYEYGFTHHPSPKDVQDVGAVAGTAGLAVTTYGTAPPAKVVGNGLMVGGAIALAGGQLAENHCPSK